MSLIFSLCHAPSHSPFVHGHYTSSSFTSSSSSYLGLGHNSHTHMISSIHFFAIKFATCSIACELVVNPIYTHTLSIKPSSSFHVKRLTQLYCACACVRTFVCGFFSFHSIGIRALKSKSMSTTAPHPTTLSHTPFSSHFMLCFNRNELKTILAQNFGPIPNVSLTFYTWEWRVIE